MKKYSVAIKIPGSWSFDPIDGDRICPALQEWLVDSCAGRWTYHFSFCYKLYAQTVIFAFDSEDEAVAFKLRWA